MEERSNFVKELGKVVAAALSKVGEGEELTNSDMVILTIYQEELNKLEKKENSPLVTTTNTLKSIISYVNDNLKEE